jgi:hypothetical protein
VALPAPGPTILFTIVPLKLSVHSPKPGLPAPTPRPRWGTPPRAPSKMRHLP